MIFCSADSAQKSTVAEVNLLELSARIPQRLSNSTVSTSSDVVDGELPLLPFRNARCLPNLPLLSSLRYQKLRPIQLPFL